MNSYLQISLDVLSKTKLSMSAREILDAAYRLQVVPDHLFGKTQHKTLHARLSEEILRNRKSSLFTRTAPGRFSLRARLPTSEHTKGEYIAPQRSYQLKQFDVLCADVTELNTMSTLTSDLVEFAPFSTLFTKQIPLRHAERDSGLMRLRILVIIQYHDSVLTVTALDGADTGSGRSIGLLGYVKGNDADLFSSEHHGIDKAAWRTIIEQSDAPAATVASLSQIRSLGDLRCLRVAGSGDDAGSVVLLVEFKCGNPEDLLKHFPAHRAPRWTRIPAEINDITSLEPVSRQFLDRQFHGSIF